MIDICMLKLLDLYSSMVRLETIKQMELILLLMNLYSSMVRLETLDSARNELPSSAFIFQYG